MSIGVTGTSLLAAVRRRVMASSATADGSADADFFDYADAELQSTILPLILRAQEEYFVTYEDQTIVAGTLGYRIPYRAVGRKVRRVCLVSAAGDETDLARIQPDDKDRGAGDYYVQNDKLVLTSASMSGTLRQYYQMRPSALVAATTGSSGAIAVVSSINTGTKTITTTATVPSTYSTSVTFDLVRAKPGYECLGIDLTATTCTGTTWTGAATLPTDLAVGDYVCLAQQTPVPQIPPELHPLLAQAMCVRYLEARGDSKLGDAAARMKAMMEDAVTLITPRDEGSPKTVVHNNPFFGGGSVHPLTRSR